MTLTRAAAVAAGVLLCAATTLWTSAVRADGAGDPKAVSQQDGMYVDKNGNPTFDVKGKKVDFYTYVGFVQYSANCLQCHGPDGLGSTYAPSLVNALQHIDYNTFMATVSGGKQDVTAAQNLVMPALGTNKNVMCYINPIYVYLRARANDAVDRGRPEDHEAKPDGFSKTVDQCLE